MIHNYILLTFLLNTDPTLMIISLHNVDVDEFMAQWITKIMTLKEEILFLSNSLLYTEFKMNGCICTSFMYRENVVSLSLFRRKIIVCDCGNFSFYSQL